VEDKKTEESKIKFICPNDGEISQDDVVFLCNVCSTTELKEVDGMYVCDQCENSAHPLECRMCGSKDVHLHSENLDWPKKDEHSVS
jgi:hypothetical protein